PFERSALVWKSNSLWNPKLASREALGSSRWAMSRKVTRQSRVSMERIKAAANSRLMRLAQKMIVGRALLQDRVVNSHLHRLATSSGPTTRNLKRSWLESWELSGGFKGVTLHFGDPVWKDLRDFPEFNSVFAWEGRLPSHAVHPGMNDDSSELVTRRNSEADVQPIPSVDG